MEEVAADALGGHSTRCVRPPAPVREHRPCAVCRAGRIPAASRILPAAEPADRDAGNEQEEASDDEIETDRDSFTPATTVVGYKRLVVESAWSYIDNRSVADTNSLPELVCRYGVSDWLELRLGFNYEVGGRQIQLQATMEKISQRMAGESNAIARFSTA